MVTQKGFIKEITKNGMALVSVQRGEACGQCSSKGACRSMTANKEMLVEAINSLQAQVGDQVEVSLPSDSFLKISFFVYFVPVVALVAGAVIGAEMAEPFHLDPTLASAFCGGLGMVLTFLAVKVFDAKASNKSRYWPRITRLLPAAASTAVACDSK